MVLAPMADVTDAAFRRLIAKYGRPDVMWTEFVSCDGLCSEEGRSRLLVDLDFTPAERPIVAQIFGGTPEHFYRTALLLQELGFDGIDINMGCPADPIEKQCAGAALIKNPKLAQEIIRATMRGAGALPVSVKTRIGYRENTIAEWLPALLEAEPALITVHARTRKEMSLVPARWDVVAEAVAIRDRYDSSPDHTLIFGNGDVKTVAEGEVRAKESGADGVMIGRGIFGNPWLFARSANNPERMRGTISPSLIERLRVMLEHTELFEELFGSAAYEKRFGLDKKSPRWIKSFDMMKKHYQAYVRGWDGAKELRMELMEAEDSAGIREVLSRHGF